MAIIISKDGKDAERIDESNFDYEDDLQQYISDNPDVIPIYEIGEDIQLLIVAREFETNSGPIDALGLDQSGNIYLIETKLYKNADKRRVVAQVLDYGAALWRTGIDFDEFTATLNTKVQELFKESLHDKIGEYFGLEPEEVLELLDSARDNLNMGVFKFVVLLDRIDQRLKDLTLFINQNSQFDLYVVEFEYYKHKSFEIIIPRMHGTEVKKSVGAKKSSASWESNNSTEENFWADAKEKAANNPAINLEILKEFVKTGNKLVDALGGSIEWHHVVSKTRDTEKLILRNKEAGKIFVGIDADYSFSAYISDESSEATRYMRAVLNKLVDEGMMGKNESHRKATQFFINLKHYDDSENEKLLKYFKGNDL